MHPVIACIMPSILRGVGAYDCQHQHWNLGRGLVWSTTKLLATEHLHDDDVRAYVCILYRCECMHVFVHVKVSVCMYVKGQVWINLYRQP